MYRLHSYLTPYDKVKQTRKTDLFFALVYVVLALFRELDKWALNKKEMGLSSLN